MKKSLLALFCILTLALSSTAQEVPIPVKSFISGQGKARIEKKPDIAYLTFYVKADGTSATEVIKQLEESTEVVIDALKQTGKNKIRSVQKDFMKLGEKDNNFSANNMNKTTPQAINQITLTIEPSLELAAELIDVIINNEASLKMMNGVYSHDNIANSSVVFGLEKSEEAEKEATDKAIEDAKSNARRTADFSDRKIGKPVSINPNYNYIWNNNPSQRKFKAKYISADYEKVSVEVSISASFQLLDN